MGEIEPRSRSLQRFPWRGTPEVSDDDSDDQHGYLDDEEPGPDWSSQLAAIRRHQVTLACLALILITLIWKIEFVSRYYFRQDDFEVMDLALRSSLSWSFLTHGYVGHFFPGVFASAWVLSRIALYNWPAAAGVVMVLVAAASLAAWRLLRTLLGNRPAILIPLTLYLVAPIGFENYSWWIAGIEAIPLQVAIFMCLDAHVRYVRTGKTRSALAAAAWLGFGLAFDEKAVVIPLVLFAVTAWFLVRQRGLLATAQAAAVRYWHAWVAYLILLGAYGAALVGGLASSAVKPAAPSSVHAVVTFCWELVHLTLLPGLLGGPWHWYHLAGSSFAYAGPPSYLAWAAMVAVLAFVAATILTRRRAWRAWVILAGWVVLADMLPVVLGRLQAPGTAAIFGMETRYVSDSAAILAIVLALACWPVAGQGDDAAAPRRREFFTGRWRAVGVAMVAVITVGSVWSVQLLATLTSATNARPYIANAAAALAQTPAGTVIVDRQVPPNVMIQLFGHYADTSAVLGPLSHRGPQVTWVARPQGNISTLKIFGSDGRLYPASISGVTSRILTAKLGCVTRKRTVLVVPFPVPTPVTTQVLRLAYLASPAVAGQSVTITYGSEVRRLMLASGVNNAYVTVSGTSANIVIQAGIGYGLCVADAVAGYFIPGFGPAIPPLHS